MLPVRKAQMQQPCDFETICQALIHTSVGAQICLQDEFTSNKRGLHRDVARWEGSTFDYCGR